MGTHLKNIINLIANIMKMQASSHVAAAADGAAQKVKRATEKASEEVKDKAVSAADEVSSFSLSCSYKFICYIF